MTVEDIYRVLENDEEVIIGKNSPYGLLPMHIGLLKDCDNEYMNCNVKSIKSGKGMSHGVIIEI